MINDVVQGQVSGDPSQRLWLVREHMISNSAQGQMSSDPLRRFESVKEHT